MISQQDLLDKKYTMYDVATLYLNRIHYHDIAIQILEILAATPSELSYRDQHLFGDKMCELLDENRHRRLAEMLRIEHTSETWRAYVRLTAVIINNGYVSYDIYKMARNNVEQNDRQNKGSSLTDMFDSKLCAAKCVDEYFGVE